MDTLLWILAATVLDGLVAFSGAAVMMLSKRIIDKALLALVAFSAGALLCGGLYHLFAESLASLSLETAMMYLMAGFVVFFLMEKFLHWHSCRGKECPVKPYAKLSLFGDSIHNFIDGLVIAAGLLVDVRFGLITTGLVIAHEVPQEIGDFGILVYGGYGKVKALFYNFLAQLTCVLGGIAGYAAGLQMAGMTPVLLAFAAGGFIYIAASDLVPEIHKTESIRAFFVYFAFFVAGIAFLIASKTLLG